MNSFLFFLFSGISLMSSVSVIFVLNPVDSVLCLVLTFISAAMLTFLLQIEFIPLVLIVVYVGAIAVLFLFIVMMLDIKLSSKADDFFKYLPFGTGITIFFTAAFFSELTNVFSTPEALNHFFYQEENWFLVLNTGSNIQVLGKALYTEFFIFFVLAGIILLVAMLGSITLTLKCNKTVKNQVFSRQLSRNSSKAIFLIRS
uniref:NADH-ubiquinone oxidoreductase chain 6 n=1 Tax=Aureoumbra lagunensis TaxID=44058 RepID=A0A7U0QGF9_9STRA|nr:NADH dehydrogenase subunit 6 [Aureoumbra lagunensis]QQW50397.1 NADH dehydrogenase subunit 6 [Aureoumbra lagunensis]